MPIMLRSKTGTVRYSPGPSRPIIEKQSIGVINAETLRCLQNDVNVLLRWAVNKTSGEVFNQAMKDWFGFNEFPPLGFVRQLDTLKRNLNRHLVFDMYLINVGESGYLADKTNLNAPICLGNYFLDVGRQWGEDIVTLIHEISHRRDVLGTNDEQYGGGGDDMYQALAVKSAKEKSERLRCLTNAENWAYFAAQGAFSDAGSRLSLRGEEHWSNCRAAFVERLSIDRRDPTGRYRLQGSVPSRPAPARSARPMGGTGALFAAIRKKGQQ